MAENAKKIGIFGGSFDPVHVGHLMLAEQLREAAGLDKIIFIPAYRSPFKLGSRPADGAHRLKMLKLATKDNKAFKTADIELKNEGPSYTFDTLVKLEKKYPAARLYFIVGTDSFIELDTWYRGEELLRRFSFIAGCRKGYDNSLAEAKLKEYREKYGADVSFFDIPELEISSSQIRERLKDGRSVKYIVPDPVIEYIGENGLYRDLLKELEEYARAHEKPSRFEHTCGVVQEITRLSKIYGVDTYKAQIVAWFHDTYKAAGPLEHGPLAAKKIQEDFGITDPEIIEAIEYHTTGKPGMCDLTKVMKLADMTEPTRDYPGVEEIRASITDDLDESLLMLMTETRRFVTSKGFTFADISNQAIAYLEQRIKDKKGV